MAPRLERTGRFPPPRRRATPAPAESADGIKRRRVRPCLDAGDPADLRLSASSPSIDRGDSFVDVEPLTAGLQRLPALFFLGRPRVAEGNDDGFHTIDIRSSEASPQ